MVLSAGAFVSPAAYRSLNGIESVHCSTRRARERRAEIELLTGIQSIGAITGVLAVRSSSSPALNWLGAGCINEVAKTYTVIFAMRRCG